MTSKYKNIIAVATFIILAGPGPVLIGINKYVVAILPLLSLILFFYYFREEIRMLDFNEFKKPLYYTWAFKGLIASIYAHAICTLIFKPPATLPETLLTTYQILPFYMIVAAPLLEETVYRKIVFRFIESKSNFWTGAIVSSLLFALAHFSLDRLLAYFLVGMILSFVYNKTKSLIPCLLIHIALNFISVFMGTIRG